jgi:hypothetical protein
VPTTIVGCLVVFEVWSRMYPRSMPERASGTVTEMPCFSARDPQRSPDRDIRSISKSLDRYDNGFSHCRAVGKPFRVT